ncbi:MAG: DUF3299 domain-containing protein [Pseudomonadota bacterium]
MKLKNICLLLFVLALLACEKKEQNSTRETSSTKALQVETITTLDWDNLIPASYAQEKILDKYQQQLDTLEDDSPELEALYLKIFEEINNAPLNEKLSNKWIKLSGFIAPLNYHNGKIIEFLLVPYFGACIHVPAPPANQTVLVKTLLNKGIKPEDAFVPIWVSGQIQLEGKKTDIGSAGYSIKDAKVEIYTEEQMYP